MASFPLLGIQQQPAKLGFYTEPGFLTIRQPKASLNIEKTPAKLDITSPPGELTIDQSRAWDALGIGSHLAFMKRVYDQSFQIGLQGIARIASDGDQLAAIHLGGNPIADIARREAMRDHPMDYVTEASIHNVDISYQVSKPDIQVNHGSINVQAQAHRPEISYERGRLHYEMLQHASLRFIPPQLDYRL